MVVEWLTSITYFGSGFERVASPEPGGAARMETFGPSTDRVSVSDRDSQPEVFGAVTNHSNQSSTSRVQAIVRG
jgi:hypothetical protein